MPGFRLSPGFTARGLSAGWSGASTWALGALISLLAAAPPAMGQPLERADDAPSAAAEESGDPWVLMQAGAGLAALPGAELCPSTVTACEPGETIITLYLQALVRWADFAAGVGTSVGFGLRPGTAFGAAHLEREHSRNYFAFEGLFRYYPPPLGEWEWWLGGSIGAVLLADVFSTEADRNPYADVRFVGPQRLTLGSEGLTVGAGLGGHWHFADRWLVDTHIRYSNWIFPNDRAVSPLGDSASLAGRVDVLDVALMLGFDASL